MSALGPGRILACLACLVPLGAGTASAHVDVLPTRISAESASELTVRVPTERDVATVAVRVDVPDGVTAFSTREPPPGWRVRTTRGVDGRIASIEWRGGRIGVGEYQDFQFLATPTETGETLWPSLQTYADGLVKPWTEQPAGEDEPAIETGPTDPGPAAVIEVVDDATAAPADTDEDGGGSDAGVWLGLIAIGISVLAALGVGFLWSSRPARLPPEEDA